MILWKGRDEEYLEMLIDQEKQNVEVRKHLFEEEAKMEKQHMKKKNKEALIDELVRMISFSITFAYLFS